MRVHLVDGTFELFRCFHGAPRARLADGREAGAAQAFLATLVSLLRRRDVTHVALAFDAGIVGTRGSGGRPAAGESATELLQRQYGLATEVVRALRVVLWPMARRFQADDALATAAHRFHDAPGVEQVVICTTDKDLAQCVVGTRVVLLDRTRDRITDEAAVLRRFGVPPRLVPAYHALVGDASDGLPGIPGWGPKSTATLLTRYGSLEAIPDDVADWDVSARGAARLAASLRERRNEATLYRNLSILRTDVPLVESTLRELEWPGPDDARLRAIAETLEVPGIPERLTRPK